MLRFCKSFVSRNTLKMIYNALILPHFDYCSLVWSNCTCSETLKLNLQKLQNRAAKKDYDASSSVIYNLYARDDVASCHIRSDLGLTIEL